MGHEAWCFLIQVYLYPIRGPPPPSRLHIHTSTYEHDWPYSSPVPSQHGISPVSPYVSAPRTESGGEKREETTRWRERERALGAASGGRGGVSGCDLTPPHVVALHKATQRSAALAKPVLSPMTPSSARSSRPLTNGSLEGVFPFPHSLLRGGG